MHPSHVQCKRYELNAQINFWKSVYLKNPSLGPEIRLPIGKVSLRGSTPLSTKDVSTD